MDKVGFCAQIVENFFRSFADLHQPEVGIHDEDAERRVLDEVVKGFVIAAQLLFSLPARGDVSEDAHCAE